MTGVLKADTKLLLLGEVDLQALADHGFQVLEIAAHDTPIALAFRTSGSLERFSKGFTHTPYTVLVVSDPTHPLDEAIVEELGIEVILFQDLHRIEIPRNSSVILTPELDNPLLSTATEQQYSANRN